ncbi:transmembrane protease serine 3-like [Tubulanus polymorphus]|uniref:transmembrane protease serine 3-like n=1 Tax=Tubulanus polymorphus TaxID=672921 RepID=UPI003DA4AF50
MLAAVVVVLFTVLVSASTAAPEQCGVSSGADDGWRIISGTASKSGQWPWQVSLHFLGRHVCGGTLINKNTILTAAHCTKIARGTYPHLWEAVIGEINIKKPKKKYLISKVERHIRFVQFRGFDIAIMKLTKDVEFSSTQMPACLPSHDPSPDDTCYASGFGQTYKAGVIGRPSEKLMHVAVDIINTKVCARAFRQAIIDTRTICAGGASSKNVCKGDSGGPLVCKRQGKWYVHGVTSFGNFPCGRKGEPGVYTRVTSYLDWINERA